jgi:hypothetical protein
MSRPRRNFLWFLAFPVSVFIGSIIKDVINGPVGNKESAAVVNPDPVINLGDDMKAYCSLPIEFKTESDSITVMNFSDKISKYPSDKRDYLCSFANLYSRFMIDMLHNEYDFIHLRSLGDNGYFELGDDTKKEYDSLYTYYGCHSIKDIKLSNVNSINIFADSMNGKKNLKYIPNYMKDRENAIEYGLGRNYLWIFHKVLFYI